MKNSVFWDEVLCRVEKFASKPLSHTGPSLVNFYLEDGGDTFLRNGGSHKIFTAPHPTRRDFSLVRLSTQDMTCPDS
jgi:hypothetical protein